MLVTLMYVLCVLVGGTSSYATRLQFPSGQLIQNVTSKSSPGQRFAIYVPTTYDTAHPAPILYVMDPRGRGRLAASLFQPAAERYGYIIVSSCNTESDSLPEVTLRALQAMWTDSHDWFQIDDRRVYLAGFSGTARIASLVARNRRDAIAGIISAGAGFHPDVKPQTKGAFLYFGTVGDEDYNFHEIESLERSLVSLDLGHRVERFHGPHSWMPPPLAMRAIEWLELRSMQAGSRPQDARLIDEWWRRDEQSAAAAMLDGRTLDAARIYAAMTRDFAGLRDTAKVRGLAAHAMSTREAKTQRSRRQSEGQQSREWLRTAMQIIADAFPAGASAPLRTPEELARDLEVPKLKRMNVGPPTDSGLEAKRRLNEMEVQLGFYLAAEASRTSELPRERYYLSTALLIDARSPVTLYLLSETHAQLKARREALDMLRRAIDAGFRDAALLEADPAFHHLRGDAEFTLLVQQLRANGDVLDLLTVDRPPPPIPVR